MSSCFNMANEYVNYIRLKGGKAELSDSQEIAKVVRYWESDNYEHICQVTSFDEDCKSIHILHMAS